jgi:hypothetical protein
MRYSVTSGILGWSLRAYRTGGAPTDPGGSSMFQAVEQFGPRLDSRKEQIDTLDVCLTGSQWGMSTGWNCGATTPVLDPTGKSIAGIFKVT